MPVSREIVRQLVVIIIPFCIIPRNASLTVFILMLLKCTDLLYGVLLANSEKQVTELVGNFVNVSINYHTK
jgi:hypothetical protein